MYIVPAHNKGRRIMPIIYSDSFNYTEAEGVLIWEASVIRGPFSFNPSGEAVMSLSPGPEPGECLHLNNGQSLLEPFTTYYVAVSIPKNETVDQAVDDFEIQFGVDSVLLTGKTGIVFGHPACPAQNRPLP